MADANKIQRMRASVIRPSWSQFAAAWCYLLVEPAWDGGKSTSAISNCSARVADLEKSWRTNPPIAQGFSSAPCHRKQGTLRRLRNHRSSPPVWAWWGSLPGHTRTHLSPFSLRGFATCGTLQDPCSKWRGSCRGFCSQELGSLRNSSSPWTSSCMAMKNQQLWH